jgi:radical SAM protein with 4Fe4S-binding SPASM domain
MQILSAIGKKKNTSLRGGTPHPGLYHFDKQANDEHSRIHLRIDSDRSGVLIVNASRMLHLNPTAAFMAYHLLSGTTHKQAIQAVCQTYHVSKTQASNDYTQFANQLNELIRPDGACPVHELELDILAPFQTLPSAPYRMDLALTYRCNNDCAHCYNARPRNYQELSVEQWKWILDQLWQIGIPHIVFTGGEPTLYAGLPELIAHAQQNGQITGVNTNGRRLSDRSYLQSLVDAGLDHLQVTLESSNPSTHDAMVKCRGAWTQTVTGIKNALDTRLFVMTNTTMLTDNIQTIPDTLDFLAEIGVPTVGLNALIYSGKGATVGTGLAESALKPILQIARQKTEQAGQRLIWYTPTQYCHFDPMELELGIKGCTAALYNMCIEPDGAVLPCQSFYQSLGNILVTDWRAIWEHDLALALRQRKYIEPRCQDCALLAECGAGCPLTSSTRGLITSEFITAIAA